MSLLVNNPIINSPFEEPIRFWEYKDGQPVLAEGRRPAGFYLKARRSPTGTCSSPKTTAARAASSSGVPRTMRPFAAAC